MTPDAQARALQPCPFCGGNDVDAEFARSDNDIFSAGCMTCGGVGPNATPERDQVDAWNTRAARSTWTDETPKETGIYVLKEPDCKWVVWCVEITFHLNPTPGLYVFFTNGRRELLENLSRCQWARIEMPEEP